MPAIQNTDQSIDKMAYLWQNRTCTKKVNKETALSVSDSINMPELLRGKSISKRIYVNQHINQNSSQACHLNKIPDF